MRMAGKYSRVRSQPTDLNHSVIGPSPCRVPRVFSDSEVVTNRYNHEVTSERNERLERVCTQLQLYEHPWFTFSAVAKDEGVIVRIAVREPKIAPPQEYEFSLHPRDLDHPQFEWQFQRQLYDALHDYLMEMFTRTPQDLSERRESGA
jgi:hypothetical protein